MNTSAIPQSRDRIQEMPNTRYTDAPLLHPNLFLGSLQLLGWLFFRPTAWRNHIIRMSPGLHPDFCLAVLTPTQWRDRQVQRLLVQCYVVWTIMLAFFIASILYLLDGPEHLLLGITFGVLSSIVFNLALGTTCSVAGGLLGSFIGGVGVGVGMGMAGGVSHGIAGGVVVDNMLSGVTIGVGIGITGDVMATLSGGRMTHNRSNSFFPQIGSIIIGVVVSGIAYSIVYSVLNAVSNSVIGGIGCALMYGVLFSITTYLRTTRLWFVLATGVIFGVLGGVTEGTMFHLQQPVFTGIIGGVLGGISGGVWLSAFFVLATVLSRRVGGSWAGAAASAFGLTGIFITDLMLNNRPVTMLDMFLGLACTLAGLTLTWWRPIVFYPFLAAWNTLLYHADLRRSHQQPSLLRWHVAFWDEFQRLPLAGLDDHLLLVLERNPAEGLAAMEYLARSHQRWAAQSAQIELDARLLEHCPSVAAMSTIAAQLVVGDLTGPANALLRSFSRISQDVAAALRLVNPYHQRLALRAIEDQLDGLLRELTRSSEPYALRFRPIVTHWHRLVAEQHQLLALTAEQRQEIDNPYVVGLPLSAQQAIFVGRTGISRQIESLLLDRQCPPLLLYGQRRIGKTSLLNNLGRLLPHDIVPLFIDLQGPVALATSHAGLLAALVRAMRLAAQHERALTLPPLPAAELMADPFPRFDVWLDATEQVLAHRTALLMLDEFEVLESFLAEGSFDERAVLGMLRHMIQHRPRLKILLAGSHTLGEVQRWASYLINVQVIPISYLSEAETQQLVEHPVQDFALRYTPEASAAVFALTRGHPALVQLLCTAIIEGKNRQPPEHRRHVGRADVAAVIPEALQRGSFFFADIERNQTDAAGRALLRALAQQGEGAVLPMAAIAQMLPEEAALVVANLLRRELIEAVAGGYRFNVELIRRWFLEFGS